MNGYLYAGGEFTQAGGLDAAHIAEYHAGSWAPLIPTPVAVEELEAGVFGNEVRLRWHLPAVAAWELAGVVVERGLDAGGPFSSRTPVALVPEPQMAFAEPFDPMLDEDASLFYRLVLVERDGSRGLAGPVEARRAGPASTDLRPPYCSAPGGPVVLRYSLAATAPVRLDVFDVRGRLLRRVESGTQPAGVYVRTWDRCDAAGAQLGRGVYVVRLQAGAHSSARKLALREP